MDTRTLARDIQAFCGSGLVTQTQVQAFLGCGKNYPKKFLKGLQFYRKGNAKLYSVDDIAEKINREKKS